MGAASSSWFGLAGASSSFCFCFCFFRFRFFCCSLSCWNKQIRIKDGQTDQTKGSSFMNINSPAPFPKASLSACSNSTLLLLSHHQTLLLCQFQNLCSSRTQEHDQVSTQALNKNTHTFCSSCSSSPFVSCTAQCSRHYTTRNNQPCEYLVVAARA